MKWLNPLSIPAKTVEVVCFTTFTLAKKYPALETKNFPGSNIKVTFLPKSLQKELNLSES